MWEKWSRGSNVNAEGLVISALFEVEPDVFKMITFEPIFTKLRLFPSLELSPWYSTFRANPVKTGGLIFVTLISFPKLHFLHQT